MCIATLTSLQNKAHGCEDTCPKVSHKNDSGPSKTGSLKKLIVIRLSKNIPPLMGLNISWHEIREISWVKTVDKVCVLFENFGPVVTAIHSVMIFAVQ